MSNLLSRLRTQERSTFPAMSLTDYFTMVFKQNQYAITATGSSPLNTGDSFVSFVHNIHERNGVVSAAAVARALLVSQLRFVWRNNRSSSTPGRTFGDRSLAILERPGQVTRPELLFGAELDVSYAGNSYIVREGSELVRLRPDAVTVALTSELESSDGALPADARVAGIVYQPSADAAPRVYRPGEYAHWRPEIHPLHWWRGASWVTSLLDEVSIDHQATRHTEKFFERAATPNLVYVMPESLSASQVEEYADLMDQRHSGAENAYKSMYLGGGADVKVVGSNLSEVGIRDMQGASETRIASRSRVPAVVLGIREGMQGSALNSGNYSQTRRLWADGWFTPHVQNLCASLEAVVPPAADAELWFDPSEVLFLQEDQKDAAEIAGHNSQAIRALTESGYEPTSVVEAITTNDLSKLRHTGVFSVQLQPPSDGQPAADPNNGGAA